MSDWVCEAISKIRADFNRSSDTHLIKLELPAFPGIDLYFKDESTHPTGSLKHRLARSLFLYGICNGVIKENTTIVESSSGSTAVSEAYFAKLLNLPFIAVIPEKTSKEKISEIEFYGGKCKLVQPKDIYVESQKLADEIGGYYIDQFTNAEKATDWRGNNNIAESIFKQMEMEANPIPKWVVVGAGTGGTSATIGRYIRYQCLSTKLCIADPENSVFAPYFKSRDKSLTSEIPSRIEGIGRPRVEPSFIAEVIDDIMTIPDAASIAAMFSIDDLLNIVSGPSSGTNFYTCLQLMKQMRENGQTGSIVTLICDSGNRYKNTYRSSEWISHNNLNIEPFSTEIKELLK